MTATSFIWAKTEREIKALIAVGWIVADQRRSHHHFHATLMQWNGEGEPVLPEKAATP